MKGQTTENMQTITRSDLRKTLSQVQSSPLMLSKYFINVLSISIISSVVC